MKEDINNKKQDTEKESFEPSLTYEEEFELGPFPLKDKEIEEIELFSGELTLSKGDINVWRKFADTEGGKDQYGILDMHSFQILPFEYDFIGEIKSAKRDDSSTIEGVLLIKKDKKYGVVNLNGSICIPCEYDEILFLKHTNPKRSHYPFVFAAKTFYGYGLFNPYGEMLLACQYDTISGFDSDKVELKRFGAQLLYNVSQGSIQGIGKVLFRYINRISPWMIQPSGSNLIIDNAQPTYYYSFHNKVWEVYRKTKRTRITLDIIAYILHVLAGIGTLFLIGLLSNISDWFYLSSPLVAIGIFGLFGIIWLIPKRIATNNGEKEEKQNDHVIDYFGRLEIWLSKSQRDIYKEFYKLLERLNDYKH